MMKNIFVAVRWEAEKYMTDMEKRGEIITEYVFMDVLNKTYPKLLENPTLVRECLATNSTVCTGRLYMNYLCI